MIQTQPKKLTFEEYLAYEDDTDNRYELIDGELRPLPPESPENDYIPNYLFLVLATVLCVPPTLLRPHTCEVQVPVINPKDPANCYPDLVVLVPEHLKLARTRMTITLDMPPPRLVVEVVSPGKANRDRDYERKPLQYAARGILEYWIVNPQEQTVMVLRLESGRYVEQVFRGSQRIVSPTFPELELTAQQIFAAAE
jgi:Uma2 family endonuclease